MRSLALFPLNSGKWSTFDHLMSAEMPCEEPSLKLSVACLRSNRFICTTTTNVGEGGIRCLCIDWIVAHVWLKKIKRTKRENCFNLIERRHVKKDYLETLANMQSV